jgi:hypothetical protein
MVDYDIGAGVAVSLQVVSIYRGGGELVPIKYLRST